MIITPAYYSKFQCIADRCKHSCCIGWEIDIDEQTYQAYQKTEGDFGARLKQEIVRDATPHFRLGAEERCPFLNPNNLCDIIRNLGEESLCQICADHPRFRNFYTNVTEIGLGLCCEAAGELILGETEPFSMPTIPEGLLTEEEKSFFRFRNRVFSMITDRETPLSERVRNLLQTLGLSFPKISLSGWAEEYAKLEQLDPSWQDNLMVLRHYDRPIPMILEWEIPTEQLLCYFLFRHLSGGLEDGSYGERILFSVLSTYIVYTLAYIQSRKIGTVPLLILVEVARMYSSEIEYSEENTNAIFDLLV